MKATLKVRPLTPELWPALEDLFGPKGACNNCWCMYWRIGSAYRKQPPGKNKAVLHQIVKTGPPPGLIAFDGDKPVGWCQLTLREALPWLDRTSRQGSASRERAAPAYGFVAVEGDQARRWTGFYDLVEDGFVPGVVCGRPIRCASTCTVLHAPLGPERSSSAGQSSGVSGRTFSVAFIFVLDMVAFMRITDRAFVGCGTEPSESGRFGRGSLGSLARGTRYESADGE